jgi:hypothetical protein
LIIACPECSGKLSSAAPSCPHCGYVQAPSSAPVAAAASGSRPPSAPLPAVRPTEPPPELILPTDKHVRKASRLMWGEWVHSSVWRMFIGSAILLGALGLMFLVLMLALKLNDGPTREIRIEKASRP